MRTRRTILVAAATAVLTVLALAPASPAAAARYSNLDPGGQPRLTERVPVNVVFLGYSPSQVPRSTFSAGLPADYEPVVRSRQLYMTQEKLGLHYDYDYRISYTDERYEDRFFGELKRLARPAPLSEYQTLYNAQQGNVLDVTENHHIDAPSVERWLAKNPPAGVDTRRNTVFLINWYGRPDFRFHVYTKTDEPDPDTGYNFGTERESRKIIAWGGTTANDEENGLGSTHRIWFHDLSAGPESWTSNWNVDDPDLDGNGVEDYRMPPTWEYTPGGYRAASALAGDLSKITRYVALNLLFTTSPLYPAELPTAEPPRSINLDSNVYEGWPGVDASTKYIDRDLLLDELRELRWRNRLDYDSQDLPFTGDAERCYRLALETDESCYPETGYPGFANFYLQNQRELARTQDDQGKVDYEMPIFSYAVPEGTPVPALGFADDNWVDGTQSYVFAFISPEIVESGYGLTTTLIHEVGHHIGMSHPHDGYDSASEVDYVPADEFYFVNAGDQTNSMMSYIDLNWDFSQFDHDNSDRFLTAAYNEAANRLAADVLDAPRAHRAYDELAAADRLLGRAKAALANHQYRSAQTYAEQAYSAVVDGAREVGVPADKAAKQLSQEAKAARTSVETNQPHEFIDSLDPDGPRAQS
ncbi:zinc metalloprotease [Plantactinospora soyae]|uniref:Peptidase M43 pregnancy-associated plasma-A domain-containing protein n=1 Tax=Plantactinospora soyae TaxID=1544732 RepID=A0A927LYQ2_9ACTN|nr:hypothetical protein [Plantactinospora soyae]MBE1484854.1 hypothetical protein [Plantactinospora soyae]